MGLQANSDECGESPGGQRAKFVLLRHECQESHWDLMIAVPGEERLWTWQVQAAPRRWPEALPAKRIADHRKAYLTYEGEISGNRGRVMRVDEGAAEILGLEPEIRLRLDGRVVRGTFTLISATRNDPR